MIELTEQQSLELATPEPVAVDPQTRNEYVLVRREVYDRFKKLFDEDDVRLMYPGLAEVDPEDWEDASVYDDTP
jgi:hypothetical protein